ncbi:hypothetical protein KKF25_02520, partial [Patescibacteria group bacterium]|nr:hypothetical protein [Patescibacteria group bacterium]
MGCPSPKGLQKARAMRLYSERFIAIWLERSGAWLVRLDRSGNDESYQRVDSQQLAEIMLQESGNFLKQSLHWRVDGLAEEIPPVKDIASYNALIPCVLSHFFKNAQEMIEERESKLHAMRERLSLLGEFVQSLDPLISQGKTVEIKDYTIFSHYERGASSVTDSYFCPEALEPFWNEIKARRQGSSGYEEHVSKYHFNSLGQFLQRMVWVSEEIQKERERRREPGEAAVNFRTGRLPLTEGEFKAIEEAVMSITAKE